MAPAQAAPGHSSHTGAAPPAPPGPGTHVLQVAEDKVLERSVKDAARQQNPQRRGPGGPSAPHRPARPLLPARFPRPSTRPPRGSETRPPRPRKDTMGCTITFCTFWPCPRYAMAAATATAAAARHALPPPEAAKHGGSAQGTVGYWRRRPL